MKSITKQTCYKMKVLNLTYSTMIIVNQREEGEGQARAEEKSSGDQEFPGQCFTIPFTQEQPIRPHIDPYLSTYD